MFRSAGSNSNGLYSPAAASDSSGFSEQPFSYTTFNPAFRRAPPVHENRSLSPQGGFHKPRGQKMDKLYRVKVQKMDQKIGRKWTKHGPQTYQKGTKMDMKWSSNGI